MLSSLTVVELASVLAGPSVGQFFAEMGARVIKVENPNTGGDVTRRWRAPGAEDPGKAEETDDRSAYFCACNAGKESVAIDLTTDDGREAVYALTDDADVVLQSYRPGQAERLGVDAETLRSRNPALIVGEITGYGPDDDRAGYDAVIQAEAGYMSINGPADGPPTKLPVALMDVLAGHQLKEGLLAALLERAETGDGRIVSVSLFQAAVSGLVNQATNYLVAGHVPGRMGSAHPNIAPYGTPYPTADGREVVLAVGTDRQFERLCQILGLNDLPANPNFTTNAARVAHRDVLTRVLSVRMQGWEAEEVLQALADAGIPAGLVRTIDEVFADPTAQSLVLRPADGPPGLRQAVFGHDGPGALSAAPRFEEEGEKG